MALPLASWPVTTRRMLIVIALPCMLRKRNFLSGLKLCDTELQEQVQSGS